MRKLNVDIKSWPKKYWSDILISLFIMAIIGISVPNFYRILADEATLVGTSKAMTFDKKVDNAMEGLLRYDTYYPLSNALTKRPLLFPFSANVLHTLTGYRPDNVFILNLIILFFLLLTISICVKRMLGPPWNITAILLVSSQPLLSIVANSGGYELLNYLFFYICIGLLGWHLKRPDEYKFLLLYLSSLCFINTRYESAVPVFVIFSLLLILGKIKFNYIKKFFLFYLFSPFLLSPFLWQRLLPINISYLKVTDGKVHVNFHWDLISSNYGDLLFRIINNSYTFPIANIIMLTGVIGFYLCVRNILRSKNSSDKYKKEWLLIALCSSLSLWVLIVSIKQGHFNHPTTTRLYGIFFIWASLCTLYHFTKIRIFKSNPLYSCVLAFAFFLTYHPVAMEAQYINYLDVHREYKYLTQYFKMKPNNRFVIIYDRSNMFTIYNWSSFYIKTLREKPGMFRSFLQKRQFEDIYVVQHIRKKTWEPIKRHELNTKKFILETVKETDGSSGYFLRISKLIDIIPGRINTKVDDGS